MNSKALGFILMKQFKWQLFAAVVPRLILIGFTFCQPFAANRFMEYLSSDDPYQTKAMGYGLVGAYGLIYIGIAVSLNRVQGISRF
jgi:ATP-binding cassette, subfamily C (CFTR/MRP), member 1